MSEFQSYRDARLSRLWLDYVDAQTKAQETRDINDGIAAGRAWSRWVSEFISPGETKNAIHGNVVPIRK